MSLASLIATGTKVWLDGVEPDELQKNRAWGVTGATSNPTIVSKIVGRGGFDGRIGELIGQALPTAKSRGHWTTNWSSRPRRCSCPRGSGPRGTTGA
jgi:transaldolase